MPDVKQVTFRTAGGQVVTGTPAEARAETIAANARKGGTNVTAPEVQDAVGTTPQPPQPPSDGLQRQDGQPAALPTVTTPTPVELGVSERAASATSAATEQIAKAETIKELGQTTLEIAKQKGVEAEQAGQAAQQTLEQIRQLEEARTPRAELRVEAEEKFNFLKKLENREAQSAKVAKISGEIEKLNTEEQAKLEAVENQVASVGTINAAKRRIQTEFARLKAFKSAELNAEAALLAVYNNELEAAQSRVDDFVQDATFDDQLKFQRMSFIVNQEQEFFNSLNSQSQAWLKQTMEFTESRLKDKQERLNTVMNLQVEAAKLGVTLGWTTQKIAEFAADDGGVAAATERFNAAVAPVRRFRERGVRQTEVFVDEAGKEISPFEAARSIVEANPDASEIELRNAIRENVVDAKGNPILNISETNDIIAEVQANQPPPTPEDIKQKIVDVLEPQKDFFSRSEARAQAENQIKEALGLDENQSIPKSFRNAIEDALVEVYGRTFGQRFFPGGR